jgi:hypothetical protein
MASNGAVRGLCALQDRPSNPRSTVLQIMSHFRGCSFPTDLNQLLQPLSIRNLSAILSCRAINDDDGNDFEVRAETHIHEELVDEKSSSGIFADGSDVLTVSMLAGLLVSLQLIRHNPFAGIELFSPGRWRMVHTNAVAYGFLANGFLGCLHWAIPRLTLQPVFWTSGLSWFIYAAWQAVVGATAVGILLGRSSGAGMGRNAGLD